MLQAARRQENREAWKKALVIAEFARWTLPSGRTHKTWPTVYDIGPD